MRDFFNLQRFIDAQAGVEEAVGRELAAGKKRSHWMWFVFPQVKGLGNSPTAYLYAIGSLREARAYLSHPVLGERLRNWTKMVLDVDGRTAQEIFGYPDYLKFQSSMTLFEVAEKGIGSAGARKSEDSQIDELTNATSEGGASIFEQALQKYYSGIRDEASLRFLRSG